MQFRGIPRLYRRAVLIYLGTIAAPVCGLLWLGVQSFERQRQSLAALTAEKLAVALESSTLAAARDAFEQTSHPIARYRFLIEHGADLPAAAAAALQKALDASREMVPAKNGAYGTMMAMNMSTAALPQQYLSLLESLISSLR